MPRKVNKASGSELAYKLSSLRKAVSRAQRATDKADILLYGVQQDLQDLEEHHSAQESATAAKSEGPGGPQGTEPGSAPVIGSAILVPNSDGSALLRIDDHPKSILLPLSLAALMEALKTEDGFVNDALVGWKSVKNLQAALQKRTQQSHSPAAIKELIYRLRDLLQRHGESRRLVQNQRGLGYRLALTRKVGTLTNRLPDVRATNSPKNSGESSHAEGM